MARLAARAKVRDGDIILVAALFLLLGALWLDSPAHYHGDERFYTDAALRMIERHDPWTPVYAGGELRLNKPLLTYWVLIGTYVTAGVSLFLSRIPFLIAGALLVWLTGRLARVMFPRDPAVALIAACILASDVAIVTMARRSTPDILLALAATATLYGLARILVARETGLAPRAWLWIGAGLAVATKGGLGLVVVAFGFAAAFLMRKASGENGDRVRLRELLEPRAMGLGIAIALVGLVPGFVTSPHVAGPTFFEDQVSARLAESPVAALKQAATYAGSLLKHFAPWVVLLVVGLVVARPVLTERLRRDRRALWLALSWTAALWVVFSLANTHRGRYLVPAHPVLACALAAWLHDLVGTAAVQRTARALAIALVCVGTVAALALARADLLTALSVFSIAAAALLGWKLVPDAARSLRALALGLLAAAAVAGEAVRALVDPSPVRAATHAMSSNVSSPRSAATVGFPESTASQLRVVSGGKLDPTVLPADANSAQLEQFDALLATAGAQDLIEKAGFQAQTIGRIAPNLDAASAWRWLSSPDPRAWLLSHGEPVLLGLRPARR